jgi:hypothetical protein
MVYVKPRIFAAPHLVAPMGAGSPQACTSLYSASCMHMFSCQPFNGAGCIDICYNYSCGLEFFIVVIVAAPIVGK